MANQSGSASQSASNLAAMHRAHKKSNKAQISPMQLLRKLPHSFTSHLNLFKDEEEKSNDIDEIGDKCTSKVLVILMEPHIMIDYTTLSEYILNESDFQHLALPNIKIIDNEDFGSFSNDSQIDVYIKLAKLIEKYYFEYDGFVVIEQINRLAYSASYLSFMLENLSKGVVLTSSTTKIDDAFNDAKTNLISSLIIAGRTNINEVCVCFDRKVYRGNRVIRHDQASHYAFSSPNLKPIASFGSALIINKSSLLPISKKGFRIFTKMFKDIIVLYITPVTNILLFKHLLCNKKKKGIVIGFYGAGNAPESKQLKDILKTLVDNQCNIVITTQCLKGHINMSLYASGSYFSDLPLINGHDMTVEAIVAKLSYLMGKGYTGIELRNKFDQSLVGELTPMHLIKGRIVDYKTNRGDHHGVHNIFDK